MEILIDFLNNEIASFVKPFFEYASPTLESAREITSSEN